MDFSSWNLNDETRTYLHVHAQRYEYLLDVVQRLRGSLPEKGVSILDIGPSYFTQMLEERFSDDKIMSLGFAHEKSRGGQLPSQIQLDSSRFFHFDLNDTQFPERWIQLPACDIAVMAEVIEHLHTAPTLVLKFLKTHIKPDGYLIIQTPNAVALAKRIQFLLGRNPFGMIRENADNPGHFREYTVKELRQIAENTGFTVIQTECISYFNPRNRLEKVYIDITNMLPSSLRTGITMVLQNK
jgi:trans-aconitate methyltransferase